MAGYVTDIGYMTYRDARDCMEMLMRDRASETGVYELDVDEVLSWELGLGFTIMEICDEISVQWDRLVRAAARRAGVRLVW
jgi:hypothetical protein